MAATSMPVSAQHLRARLGSWRADTGPLYQQLAEAVRGLARNGDLPTGAALPSERALAGALAVSRNTVTLAYTLLREDGWLIGPRGRAPRVGTASRLPAGSDEPGHPLAALFGPQGRAGLDLTIASPAPAPAVLDGLARLHELWPGPATEDRGYYPAGHPALLDAIVEKLRRDGIPAEPEQIVVTSGAQQALALVADTLRRPRNPVAVEDVTYPGLIDAVTRRSRSNLLALPVGDHGLRADVATRLIRATSPAAVYLTTFQNPTGQAIERSSADRLLRAVRAAGAVLVEDRALADLPLTPRRPPQPMAAHAPPDTTVITLGSLSKLYWGGLRIGWIHTNAGLASHLRARRRAHDLGSPAPMQYLAAWLLREHDVTTRRWRTRRLAAALAATTRAVDRAGQWHYQMPAGGPNLWLRLRPDTAHVLARRAAGQGIAVAVGDNFTVLSGVVTDRIRIPLYHRPRDLTAGIATLAQLLDDDHRPVGPPGA